MKRAITMFRVLMCFMLLFLVSCHGWILEYGKPAAQFDEKAVLLAHGEAYLGKKITVKGVVADITKGHDAKIELESGIECYFHKNGVGWADHVKKGEEVYVDGILNTLEKNKVILKPVGLRDPKASFEPFKK